MTNDAINAAAKRLRDYDASASAIVPLHPYRETPFLHAFDVDALAGWAVGHTYGVLRPLEWYPHSGGVRCDTIVGRYLVDDSFWWGPNFTSGVKCESKDAGKSAAWLAYVGAMAQAFTMIGLGTVPSPIAGESVMHAKSMAERIGTLIGSDVQRPNWDSYGACPIETRTIEVAKKIAERLEGLEFDGLPLNSVCPGNDGSIVISDGDESVYVSITTFASQMNI